MAVGDVRLWGMGAEQVASILRQAGQDSIRLVVARPVDPSVPQFAVSDQGSFFLVNVANLIFQKPTSSSCRHHARLSPPWRAAWRRELLLLER